MVVQVDNNIDGHHYEPLDDHEDKPINKQIVSVDVSKRKSFFKILFGLDVDTDKNLDEDYCALLHLADQAWTLVRQLDTGFNEYKIAPTFLVSAMSDDFIGLGVSAGILLLGGINAIYVKIKQYRECKARNSTTAQLLPILTPMPLSEDKTEDKKVADILENVNVKVQEAFQQCPELRKKYNNVSFDGTKITFEIHQRTQEDDINEFKEDTQYLMEEGDKPFKYTWYNRLWVWLFISKKRGDLGNTVFGRKLDQADRFLNTTSFGYWIAWMFRGVMTDDLPGPRSFQDIKAHRLLLTIALVLPLLRFAVLLYNWSKHGKNEKGERQTLAEFDRCKEIASKFSWKFNHPLRTHPWL